ncbi:MAG: TetR family transcriptional regulator C-terminal domain-containing protein [Bacteroidota bacterium]
MVGRSSLDRTAEETTKHLASVPNLIKQKNNISKDELIDYYMETVVNLEEESFTVEELGATYNFTPEAFYAHFEGFDQLNKVIFGIFIDNAIEVLSQNTDYEEFTKKDKLLSLYFTLFENLTLNRGFVLLVIKSYGLNLNALPLLSELRSSFMAFIDSLQIETIRLSDTLESIQQKSLREGLWIQFLLTLKFWMSDDSPQCEKTDIFIEKSVNTGLELINTKSLYNVIDLGKFLYTEKIKPKGQE